MALAALSDMRKSVSLPSLRLTPTRTFVERRGQILLVANLLLAFVSAVLLTNQIGGWSVTYTNQLRIFPNECKQQEPPPPPPSADMCLNRRAHYASMQRHHSNWQQLRQLRQALATTAAIAQLQWQAAGSKNEQQLALLVASGLHTLRQDTGTSLQQLCKAALASPRVALLFLARGALPHQELWHRWLRDAVGRMPQRHAAAFGCTPAHAELLRQVCGGAMDPTSISGVSLGGGAAAPSGNSGDGDVVVGGGTLQTGPTPPVYLQQQLFSVFVHSAATFEPAGAYPSGSVFENRTLSCRITPEWGSHDLVEAERLLYRAALEDPLNQRFILISESDVPLFPASMLWSQLMSEDRSRLDTCSTDQEFTHFHLRTTQFFWQDGLLNASDWRKSSQWKMLIRNHAQLVVQDASINAIFSRHCFTGNDNMGVGGFRLCPSDEHYIPTLLAYHNKSGECDCSLGNTTQTGPTFTGWWEWGEHPHTFTPDELNSTLLHWLRREPAYDREQTTCGDKEFEEAEASYESVFADAGQWEPKQCRQVINDAAKDLAPLPRLRIPEENWKCLPGHHWSAYYPGKCCDRWEEQCNLGAVQVPDPAEQQLTVDTRVAGYKPLPPGACFLLARKFKPESTQQLLDIATNCTNGLNLLGSRHCSPGELRKQRQQEEKRAEGQQQAAAAAAGQAAARSNEEGPNQDDGSGQQGAGQDGSGQQGASQEGSGQQQQQQEGGSGGSKHAVSPSPSSSPPPEVWSGYWRPGGPLQKQTHSRRRRLRRH